MCPVRMHLSMSNTFKPSASISSSACRVMTYWLVRISSRIFCRIRSNTTSLSFGTQDDDHSATASSAKTSTCTGWSSTNRQAPASWGKGIDRYARTRAPECIDSGTLALECGCAQTDQERRAMDNIPITFPSDRERFRRQIEDERDLTTDERLQVLCDMLATAAALNPSED